MSSPTSGTDGTGVGPEPAPQTLAEFLVEEIMGEDARKELAKRRKQEILRFLREEQRREEHYESVANKLKSCCRYFDSMDMDFKDILLEEIPKGDGQLTENPAQALVGQDECYVGQIVDFDLDRNAIRFSLHEEHETPEVISIRLPGMEFFAKTPYYKQGIDFMETYFNVREMPLKMIPLYMTSMGQDDDGVTICTLAFPGPNDEMNFYSSRLDEMFAQVWGRLCSFELCRGESYHGYVQHVEPTGEIYITLNDSVFALVRDYLRGITMEEMFHRVCADPPMKEFDPALLYVTHARVDGEVIYCRSMVEELSQDMKKARVKLIDYGITMQSVDLSVLHEARYVDSAICYIDPLAFKVYGIKNTGFKPELMDQVKDILCKKELKFEICKTRRLDPITREKTAIQARFRDEKKKELLNMTLDRAGLTLDSIPT